MQEALASATDGDGDGALPRRARGACGGRMSQAGGAAPRYRYVLKSAIFFISTDYLSHRSGFQNMGIHEKKDFCGGDRYPGKKNWWKIWPKNGLKWPKIAKIWPKNGLKLLKFGLKMASNRLKSPKMA